MLCSVLSVVVAAPEKVPDGLMADLASDKFEVREKAYQGLHEWARKNLGISPELLHKAWQAGVDPEAKTRCFELMKQMVIQRQFGRGKGFVGIRMDEVLVPGKNGQPGRLGVEIKLVLPNTPAAKSGLRVGDVIVAVDNIDFSKIRRLQPAPGVIGPEFGVVFKFSEYIKSKQPDDVITLRLMRGGKINDVKVTLMKRPASADVDAFGRMLEDNSKIESERFFKKWLQEKGS